MSVCVCVCADYTKTSKNEILSVLIYLVTSQSHACVGIMEYSSTVERNQKNKRTRREVEKEEEKEEEKGEEREETKGERTVESQS